jgi:hypothetical protein
MLIPIILFLLPVQGQGQPVEQQLQRQQQQLEQVSRQITQQQQQLDRMVNALERLPKPEDRDNRSAFGCSVELRRAGGADKRNVPTSASAIIPFNLFSVVSRPADGCLPAEVRVTASYLDAADNLVCSGTVENIARQTAFTQTVNLEIRPWDLEHFVRWRNEPPQIDSGFKLMTCLNPEGTAGSTNEELSRVSTARIRATVLPVGGGMSTTEILLNLRP